MGIVYKALDTRLDRFVALKFLPATADATPDDIARFELEAKAISALNHPNIATIHGIDDVDGKKFLVLEYISGGTLKSKLKDLKAGVGVVSIGELIEYGIQMAEGLGHAHKHQIIHRDIKSDNVMLTGDGKVKITDFGLAKLSGTAQLTRAGSTIGTLAYMAPEQLRGEDLDHRADLFSFGVVLYELAALNLPFRGDHEAALMYSIANEDPMPIRSFRKDLPQSMEEVITRCLQKDRTLRYQSADEIVADLISIRQGSTSPVKQVAMKRWSKLPWVIAAVIVCGMAGLFFLDPGSRITGGESKTIAVLPLMNMSGNPGDDYFSDGMTEDILTQLVKLADLKVISRTTMMQYKGSKKSLKEIGKELNAGYVLEGSVRRAGDQIRVVAQLIDAESDEHLWAESYDREYKQVFAIQSEIAQKIVSSLRVTLSPEEKERLGNPRIAHPEAYNAYLQGSYFFGRRSKADLEKAIRYYEQALKIDPEYAPAWVGLSTAHIAQSDWAYIPVDDGYGMGRKEAIKALELDANLAEAYATLGWIKRIYDWDWTGADAAYKKALELEPGNADVVRGAAGLARTLGRFDEAIALDRRSIELDPLRVVTFSNLGVHSYYAGRLDEAEEAFRKVLELNPHYPGAHLSLGLIDLVRSKPEAAIEKIKREPEPIWRDYGMTLSYYALGMKKEADSTLSVVIKEYQKDWAFQIAEIYSFRDENDKAFEWLEIAYKQRDGGLSEIKGNPLLRSIMTDRRYEEFMKKMKLPL